MKRTPFFLLALFASNLFAEEASENSALAMQRLGKGSESKASGTKTERVSALEAQMNEVFTGTVRGDFGAKAASARPRVDGYRVFVKGELLLWKEYMGGDDYAFTDQDVTSNFIGTNKHLSFDWSWGARAELGYHLPHDSWDALIRYTWFQTRASNKIGAPKGGAAQSLYTDFLFVTPTSASSNWKTKLSVIDFELGKDYFLNHWLSCKPFLGIKTAWIHQKMNSAYAAFPNSFTTTYVQGKNNFWGIGPWSGVTSTAYFAEWMNLFCTFGGSLMVGDFQVLSQETQGAVPTINLNQNTTLIAPTAQAALGLGWDFMFNRNRNHISVKTSYEVLYWWRQNQLSYYGLQTGSTPPPQGRYAEDLAFHGCTLDFTLDF